MDKKETLAQKRLQVMRRQAKVIIIQWVTILVLFITVFVLAFNLSKAHAAAYDEPLVTPATVTQIEPTSQMVMTRVEVPGTFESAPTSTPEPTPEPCPITEDEVTLLAKVLYRECNGLSWRGTQYGVSYQARQAAVAWCALNRLDDDAFPDTLEDVPTYPYAFAYDESAPVTDELLQLAQDVVDRWWAEKQGEQNVGRTLPETYTFFYGDGKENHFRDAFAAPYNTWDWSLPDPYLQ